MEKISKKKFLEMFDEYCGSDEQYPNVKFESAAYRNMSRSERMTAREIRRLSFELRKLSALVNASSNYKLSYTGGQLETVAYMLGLVCKFMSNNAYYEYLAIFDPYNSLSTFYNGNE